MRAWWVLLVALAWVRPSPSVAQPASPESTGRVARDPSFPPSEVTAKEALEASPRHGEFVDVSVPGSGTPIRTWVVYPERKDKAGVVVVIHEIYGLSDWLRGVAD